MAERKKFISVSIPILGTETKVLGTPEELDGKTIKLDLTRKLRGKGLTITLQIFNQNEKLVAIPKKMELVKSYIRRMMRKRIDYVEDSFKANCLDVEATIKPFLITRKRVSRAVRRNLRNTSREFLVNYVKDRTYNDICNELMAGTMQREMLAKLKKVYPLSFYDLRVFETKELSKINLEEASKAMESEVRKPYEKSISIEDSEDIQEIKEEKDDEESIEETKEDEDASKEEEVKDEPKEESEVKKE